MFSFVRMSLVIGFLAISCQQAWATNSGVRVYTGPPESSPNAAAYRAAPVVHVEYLMAFGAASILLMLFCKFHERQAPRLMFGTVAFGLMASVYGFLQSAWPLGIALGTYSIARLCARRRTARPLAVRVPVQQLPHAPAHSRTISTPWDESRINRLFGPLN